MSDLCPLPNSTNLPRERVLFDFGWKFFVQQLDGKNAPKNAQAPDFDDAKWRDVDLPHDWSIEGPFHPDNPAESRGGYLPAGIGYYRKRFVAPAGRRLTIEFEGVYMDSEVWINGHSLGRRPYGYSTFAHDLTPFLNDGGENVIAVRVDNYLQPASRWYTGSGIYRHVWLESTDQQRVAHWGTYVATPEVSAERAVVNVATTIENKAQEAASLSLNTAIVDADGQTVAETDSSLNVDGCSANEVTQSLEVANPRRWSTTNPYLYKAVSTLSRDGAVIDVYETTFGIRKIEFNPDRGFLLNDEPIRFNGVCLHHDLGCLGAACFDRGKERQVEIMRSMGVNAIRTSHQPPAPALLDICDRLGMLVMDEAFDEWAVGKAPGMFRNGKPSFRLPIHAYARFFEQWSERDIVDMIRRDRNHPSVVMWSIGNEIHEQSQPQGPAMAQRLVDFCHREDPTRPATSACNNIVGANKAGFAQRLDVAGYNYKEKFYQEDHERWPDRPIVGSETRSHTPFLSRGLYDLDAMMGRPDPDCVDFTTKRIAEAENSMRLTLDCESAQGWFIWTGFDYIGETTPHSWPSRSSYFGAVDLAGFPKDGFYFYRSYWGDEPTVHILPHWTWPGREGQTTPVWVYTNCESVELFLNDDSLGVKKLADAEANNVLHLEWETAYAPGVLRVVGRNGDDIVTEDIAKTAGDPARLEVTVDRDTIKADGQDLAFISIKVVDENGTVCPTADPLVTFNVEGAGALIGIDNGDPTSHQDFQGSAITAFNGLALGVLRAPREAGKAEVSITAEGLEGAEVSVTAK